MVLTENPSGPSSQSAAAEARTSSIPLLGIANGRLRELTKVAPDPGADPGLSASKAAVQRRYTNPEQNFQSGWTCTNLISLPRGVADYMAPHSGKMVLAGRWRPGSSFLDQLISLPNLMPTDSG